MSLPVVVVTGLPRSGTSLLMQMLAAGGIAPYTDGVRDPDIDNPRGYLELEAVKRLKQDASWVPNARGKAVKVISHLLEGLPTGERYLVVFVERDLDEILASQTKMITRLGKPAPPLDIVRRAFESHLRAFDGQAATRADFDTLRLAYADMVRDPATAVARLSRFVEAGGLPIPNPAAMVAAVDPTLYRNRADGHPS
ncbi:hypothetical protein Pla108_03750 [Botrimarina colliarenosi]|uniref:Sulfotransferase domain protein n=1 Tax=Botrimarina colliarenosi TaxID=2528001 RepID=A0A5C6AJ69_9BACT|nr:sulfotransferase [Botrimarina colliarenosi]TWT99436.1 hypothetical protein Pla108_03750 [Botrimarina colliarenosi]